MREGDLSIQLAGETLVLTPERAIYWPRTDTLLVADTHWGKAATMRSASIPIPGGTTSSDLQRLSQLIRDMDAKRLVLLGDAIHSRRGRAVQTFAALARWRDCFSDLEILLVRGNHDRGAGDPPEELRILCAEPPWTELPFVFQHFPEPAISGYALSGHLHPAIRLRGRGKERLTLCCYWFTPQFGVLPAFGSLTGNAYVEPGQHDQVFAIAEDEVIAV